MVQSPWSPELDALQMSLVWVLCTLLWELGLESCVPISKENQLSVWLNLRVNIQVIKQVLTK